MDLRTTAGPLYTFGMRVTLRSLSFVVLLLLSLATPQAQAPAAPRVTPPEQFFGHVIGADYQLPNYTKFTEYVRKLDAESDRMTVQSIGKTAEGLTLDIGAADDGHVSQHRAQFDRRACGSDHHGIELVLAWA